MTDNDTRVLPDGKHSENPLGASKHGLGIGAEEKQAGFLRALPEPVIAVDSRGVTEPRHDVVEIEFRVNIIGKRNTVEEDCQTLRGAEASKHGAIAQNFRTHGGARLLERRDHRRESGVEIGELDLEIGEINPPGGVQLGAAARNAAESRWLQRRLKRVFISFASSQRLEVLVETRDDQV